jgi:FkbH-like protein
MGCTSLAWMPDQPSDFRAQCAAADRVEGNRGNELRRLARHDLNGNGLYRLAASIRRAVDAGIASPLSRLTLGLISNATTDFVKDAVIASAARYGVALDVVTAPFGTTIQAAYDADGDILRARPDAILMALDHRAFFSDVLSAARAEDPVADAVARLSEMLRAFAEASGAAIIVQTLALPPERVFGSLDRRQPEALAFQIAKFNDRLCAEIAGTGVLLLDVEALAARVGTDQWHDPRQWISARLPFAQHVLPLYGDLVGRIVGAMRGTSSKVLVFDLDNTLWGGVIGDDGLSGLRLGQDGGVGEAFLELQRAALALKRRGIILAICSKNDERIAREALRQHPDMVLREDDFAATQINWLDKATNLELLSQRLSLGLDSFVFFDDNPAERAQVRIALPQVWVPELPRDPSTYARLLLTSGLFESVSFTDEDRSRAEQYAASSRRETLLAGSRDLGSFLASLEMEAIFTTGGETGWQRFAQLINKSNQFNLTTKRYSEAAILEMVGARRDFLLQVRLLDRFGDNGMISSVICRPVETAWEIDTWVMSCRVLNRQVEAAVLNEIMRSARLAGIQHLIGRYRPTPRNGVVRDHYEKLGFRLVSGTDEETVWVLDVGSFAAIPVHIKSEARSMAA